MKHIENHRPGIRTTEKQHHTQAALWGGLFYWENEMVKQRALRLVDTRTLDRRQWLEVRKGGIGSSDAAATVGLNPYKSQLEL